MKATKLVIDCPVCHQHSELDYDWRRETLGWSVTCGYCQHKVKGHVHADAALKAFKTLPQGMHREARLPGHKTEKSVRK